MPLDFKFEIGNPFLLGNAIGFLGYAGACKLQRVHFIRRPWHLITTMLLTGTGFQAYSGVHESFTDDLVRKRRLYVQRRRKRFNSSDDIADRVNDDKDLYKNISKDLVQ